MKLKLIKYDRCVIPSPDCIKLLSDMNMYVLFIKRDGEMLLNRYSIVVIAIRALHFSNNNINGLRSDE